MTINIKNKLHNFDKPKIMGILNITPDSFYKESRLSNTDNIHKTIETMFAEGADIIDIGAMSSRPGAKIIDKKEEWKRLEPVLGIISKHFSNYIFSIDTLHSEIAKRAVKDYGIAIINDISAGEFDKNMFETVAECKVPYIIMHMLGTPENMQQNVNYGSLLDDILYYFSERVNRLNSLGVNDIIIDPGFGFSKTIEQNYELLNKLEDFKIFNSPLLVGVSRKSMIWKPLNISVETALNGTSILNTIALTKGANIIRVHDVKEAKECIDLLHLTHIITL